MIYRTSRKAQRPRKRIQLETLESRVLLAADWQNPINHYDVNGSDEAQAVSPLDALLVINELSTPTVSDDATGKLPSLDSQNVSTYFDVTGDGYVSPIDALAVINQLSEIATESANGRPFPSMSDRTLAGSRAALSHGVEHDTLVNSQTDRKQALPDVAAGPGGEVVVVWQSMKQDGASWGVFAQRYDATGVKLGDEILVNTTTKRSQRDASVAVADDGSFVVVWNSLLQDGHGWGVYGQQFDSVGTPVGEEFLVNETTKGPQNHADVATLPGGDFVVTWEGRGTGDNNGIFMRRFSADGNSEEIRVNQNTSGDQSRPKIAAIAGGDFVITWQGKGTDDNYGILMRRFSTDGDSEEIRVNDTAGGSQRLPDIDAGPDGQFVVAWKQSDGQSLGVYAKQFAADGTSGEQFIVNQTTKGIQKAPAVAYLADGRFSVSWFGRGTGDNRGTFTRTFNGDGTAASDEELVNTTVNAAQVRPAAATVGGGYVVSWQGRGIGDKSGVFARFFSTEPVGPFNLDPLGNRAVNEGDTVSFTANVVDLDDTADNVTFSLGADAPAAASIDASTGEFTWVTTEADDGEYSVDVIATEGDFSVTRTVDITVSKVNDAPVLGTIDDVSVSFGSPVSITLSATDPDLPADSHTFTVTQVDGTDLPGWLSFDPDTLELSGTSVESDIGVSTLNATVTDADGLSDTQTFTVSITADPDPFTLSVGSSELTVDEGESVSFTATVTDEGDPDTVTLSASNLPAGADFDPANGLFTWTPGEDQGGGMAAVTVTATNGDFTTSQDVTITVNEVNQDPVLAEIGNRTIGVDEAFTLAVAATDADLPANNLVLSADVTGAPFLSFDPATGILSGTPGESNVGTAQVTVTVDDGAGGTDSETFSVDVTSGPFDVVVSGDANVAEGSPLSLTVSVQDLDGVADNAVLSAANLPGDATFDPATGILAWTPGEADGPGSYTVSLSAAEGAFTATREIVIAVSEVASNPVLAEIADQTVAVGSPLSVGIVAIDPDLPAQTVSYTVALEAGSALPAWLSFDSATQILSGTPTASDEGVLSLRVTATDEGGLTDDQIVTVTVTNATSPTLVTPIADQNVEEGEAISLDVTSSFDDADGDVLSYAIAPAGSTTEIPSWLTFANGVLSGTPPTGSIGTIEVSVTASDPDENSVSDTFAINVGENQNAAPQALAEQVFRVAPDASSGANVGNIVANDIDGDSLTYSIVGGNAGSQFSIDPSSGEITINTAGALQAGTVETLTVRVSDGAATADTTATVNVTNEEVAVAYSLQAFDTGGNAITTVTPGQEIELRLFVQDVRAAARGVFSAYVDVVFATGLLTPVAGSIDHSATYGAGTGGDFNTPGMVDELGGTDGITDLGGDPIEVARVRFTVSNDARGVVQFALNSAEDTIQHPTSVFGEGNAISNERIDFGSLTLNVQGNG